VRFETRPGGRALHRLPFDAFRASWRGRPVPGAPLLDPARIVSFGLLVGERQAGPFRLEIAALRAYRAPGAAS
jgi:monofunctional biosynthetic peptidoglycan transglycosylase